MDASHLFIGLAAVALTIETYWATGIKVNEKLCTLIGLFTVAFYGLHRIFQIRKYDGTASRRIAFLKRHQFIIKFFVGLSMLLSLVISFIYFRQYLWLFALGGVLSLLYLVPWMKNKTRVRDVAYIKILVIAISWPIATVVLPLFIESTWQSEFSYLVLERFLFFLLITIPFDIRDQLEDQLIGVKTFASLFSHQTLSWIGVLLLASICAIVRVGSYSQFHASAIIVASILAFFLLFNSSNRKPLWYFSFAIDGLIILRLILWYLLDRMNNVW